MPDPSNTKAPRRIQLRRTAGWRKPEGAIVVARPSKWGNPVPITGDWIMWTAVSLGYRGHAAGRRAAAVAIYRAWMTRTPVVPGPYADSTEGGSLEFGDGTVRTMTNHVQGIAAWAASKAEQPPEPERPSIDELRGHDLACWCPLDQPCHADVLLELANADADDPIGSRADQEPTDAH